MSAIKDGGPRALAYVFERTPMDEFENAIRRVGVVAACEWFGHAPESAFTKESILVLRARSETAQKGEAA